jgi:hypothetical protein
MKLQAKRSGKRPKKQPKRPLPPEIWAFLGTVIAAIITALVQLLK